jgi:phospholipase C
LAAVRTRSLATLALLAVVALLGAACSEPTSGGAAGGTRSAIASISASAGPSTQAAGLSRLEQARLHLDHLIFIVQENRSFDHYFGTYPGADGIPMTPDGKPKPCIPDPILGHCVRPYHSSNQLAEGGPHAQRHSIADVDGGKMDGFVQMAIDSPLYCADHRDDPKCADYLGPQGQPDVMSYHTRKDIPNYWAYADHFVLQDHMFAPADSWTLPSHLFLVSAWAASCTHARDPMSCSSNLELADEATVQRAHWDNPIW